MKGNNNYEEDGNVFTQDCYHDNNHIRMHVMNEVLDVKPWDKNKPMAYQSLLNYGYKFEGPTEYLAIDCEMEGAKSPYCDTVVRVSVVNQYGGIVVDTLIKPLHSVIQQRGAIHGIHQKDYKNAVDFKAVELMIESVCKGRVIIGHSTLHDIMEFDMGEVTYVDVSKYNSDKQKGLKTLAEEHLNANIQSHFHSSIIDARTAMALFLNMKQHFLANTLRINCIEYYNQMVDKRMKKSTKKNKKEIADQNDYYQGPYNQSTQGANSSQNNYYDNKL
jgi:hypothetical protein